MPSRCPLCDSTHYGAKQSVRTDGLINTIDTVNKCVEMLLKGPTELNVHSGKARNEGTASLSLTH